jgi:hypothetical protein
MPRIDVQDPESLWEEAKDLAEDLVDAGGDEEQVIEAIAEFLDSIIPLDKLIPGLPGIILEESDDDFFEMALTALRDLFKVDPEKREARRARRAEKKAARKAKRAAKRTERRGES